MSEVKIVRGVVELPRASDDSLPPSSVFAREAKESLLWDAAPPEKEEELDIDSTDVSEEEAMPMSYPNKAAVRRQAPKDPFEELFRLIRDHGKPESVEIKVARMTLKFKTLAIQIRVPLIALMTDSSAVSLDLDPDSEVVLKVRQRDYVCRFVASMSVSSNINLMLFVGEDKPEEKKQSNE